jgi:hypothetical protein
MVIFAQICQSASANAFDCIYLLVSVFSMKSPDSSQHSGLHDVMWGDVRRLLNHIKDRFSIIKEAIQSHACNIETDSLSHKLNAQMFFGFPLKTQMMHSFSHSTRLDGLIRHATVLSLFADWQQSTYNIVLFNFVIWKFWLKYCEPTIKPWSMYLQFQNKCLFPGNNPSVYLHSLDYSHSWAEV